MKSSSVTGSIVVSASKITKMEGEQMDFVHIVEVCAIALDAQETRQWWG